MDTSIQYLVNAEGEIQAVQIGYNLWKKVENTVKSALKQKEEDKNTQKEQPLKDFETLMQFWDFSYPYKPTVTCPHCNISTNDWKNDTKNPFILTNATIGGLLVFHCKNCGTTIRQKYFKDHVCYEHTTPKQQ